MSIFSDATRSEWIAGLALLTTIGFAWNATQRRDAANEKELERLTTERAVLSQKRDRENDQMQERLLSLETALRNCRPGGTP